VTCPAHEEGKIDLAVAGFYRDLPEGFFQAKLLTDSLASATRQNHPVIQDALGIEDFFSAKHALITLQGDFADRFSKANQSHRTRNISYGSFSFSAMAWILQDSDMALPCRNEPFGYTYGLARTNKQNKTNLGLWFRKRLKQYCLNNFPKK
jgi:DNA-binding transcriptional LysR family regulator